MALPRTDKGYSLVEMLAVLAIIGILALLGVTMMGNRQASSVRSLMDEVDGSLNGARSAAVATGRDVAVVNWGTWDPAAPLTIAQGDATLTDAVIQDTGTKLLTNIIPPATLLFGQTVSVPFQFKPSDPIHGRARIAVVGSGDWATAMQTTENGTINQDITTVVPFKAGGAMAGLITDANNPFDGTLRRTVVSGASKRFNSTFVIPIVGTSRNGGVLPGGAMGLIVVLGNGGSTYRFYNPGIRDGDGQWRRN